MLSALPNQWNGVLGEELHKPYFRELRAQVEQAYLETTCYPEPGAIFEAFRLCGPEEVRVVVLGQDPYHGPGQAQGLCFSVPEGVAHPPSLRNIFRELETDTGKPYPRSGDLSSWARQGVLLLNTILTVSRGQAGSHQGFGWREFTDAVLRELSQRQQGVVFLLWGTHARKKKKLLDTERHYILESGHPSPLSANRGHWFGNGHFSKANQLLERQGKPPVQW